MCVPYFSGKGMCGISVSNSTVAAQLGKKVTVCDRVISLVRLRVIRAGPIRLGKLSSIRGVFGRSRAQVTTGK